MEPGSKSEHIKPTSAMIQITIGPMSVQFAATAYFLASFFMAGMAWSASQYDGDKTWERWMYTLILIFFGPVLPVLLWISKPLLWMWQKVNKTFQITFFLGFYLTPGKWYNLSKSHLYNINKIATNKHKGNSIKDRIWRHAIWLVNTRNNYTYSPGKVPEF
jgi:hypothetical protein